MESKQLYEEILELLKKRASAEHEYINPYFLQEITGAISDYYEVDDDEVDRWARDMFGA